jgi:thymidylate kinase
MRGKLIVFEGVEGSGKTSQLQRYSKNGGESTKNHSLQLPENRAERH